jgi:hypothetical protein
MTYKTKSGIVIATDSTRTVVGGRGPYIEFSREQMVMDALRPITGLCPYHNQRHRYFYEYRTKDDTMVYEQRRCVSYANYLVGMFYVSPEDVVTKETI